MKKIFILLTAIIYSNFTFAQNLPCIGSVINAQIIGDNYNICNDGVHLTVSYTSSTGGALTYPSTDTYAVVQNPVYNPKVGVSCVSGGINTDDVWSQVLSMPFNFSFFGQTYNQFLIGANGQIGFDITQAGLYNAWSSSAWGPMPYNDPAVNNTICSPYHDILPNSNSTDSITYGIYGIAPCRMLVVNWFNIPMFSCTALPVFQQIVLYENTNEIEINIGSKPLCAAWNGGVAFEGIQNQAASIAYAVPGRNNTQWSTTNDSWSFVPAGAPYTPVISSTIPNIYWMDSATNVCLDTGLTFDYWPSADMGIYVIIGDSSNAFQICSGITLTKHLYVNTVIADFSQTSIASCNGGIVTFTNLSQFATSYSWDFGDGNTSTLANPIHTYSSLGPFSVMLTAIVPGCSTSITLPVVLSPTPVVAAFTATPDSICSGSQVSTNNTSTGLGITYLWSMGDGTTYSSQNVTHTYTQANSGFITITLTVTDQFGCPDIETKTIWIDGEPVLKLSSDRTVACVGDLVQFTNTLSANTKTFEYNMGDGRILTNENNPAYSYVKPGVYTVMLSGTYAKCSPKSDTKEITIDPYPELDLGSPEIICPGRDKVVLTDKYNVGLPISYLWSTGQTGNSITVASPGSVTLIASIGTCSTTVVKEILGDIDCIYQPNVFTPNGDGINDYFKPYFINLNDITSYEMVIFNRWGQQVYNCVNKNEKGWDGTYVGKKCDVDTYIYVLTMELRDGTKKSYKRDVLLMR
jgi:gliding motility-associated-like protein